MSRRTVAAEIVVLLALLVGAVGEAYTPMSPEEVRAYMARDPEGAVRDIIALDALEHAFPEAVWPERIYKMDGKDLVIEYNPSWILFNVGPLSYRIWLEKERVKRFVPRSRWMFPALLGVGIGAVLGAGIAVLLHP